MSILTQHEEIIRLQAENAKLQEQVTALKEENKLLKWQLQEQD